MDCSKKEKEPGKKPGDFSGESSGQDKSRTPMFGGGKRILSRTKARTDLCHFRGNASGSNGSRGALSCSAFMSIIRNLCQIYTFFRHYIILCMQCVKIYLECLSVIA